MLIKKSMYKMIENELDETPQLVNKQVKRDIKLIIEIAEGFLI